jgi:NADPH2:quinone reductase
MSSNTMKALICEKHGPPEELRLADVAIPQPGEGEILIRVHSAGLNFPDSLIIQDKYQIKPDLPFAPGGELAGNVTAVGPGVDNFQPGDRVAALNNWGSFAEYAVAEAQRSTLVPESMDLETASIFAFAYGTSHHAFKQRAGLQEGETVLILGASGGVGLAAVEVAKAMGARVIAGASSDEKLAIAKDHGADELVNYTTQDLKSTVKALAGKHGVDVIYDPVGGGLADPAFRTIAWEGRYLVIGFAAGGIPAVPFNLALVKGASIVGVFWGDFVARTPNLHQANMNELYMLHAEGKLKPHISARYPLSEGARAIRSIMERKVTGKVVITCSGEG